MRHLLNIPRLLLGAMLLLSLPAVTHVRPNLGSGELRIAGVQVVVSPATQTVPRDQATGLTVTLEAPALPAALLGTFTVNRRVQRAAFCLSGVENE